MMERCTTDENENETTTKNDNIVTVIVTVKGNKDESNYIHPAKNIVEILLLTLFCPSAMRNWALCSLSLVNSDSDMFICLLVAAHIFNLPFSSFKTISIGDEDVHETSTGPKTRQTTAKALTTQIRKRILNYALHSPPSILSIYCSCLCLFRFTFFVFRLALVQLFENLAQFTWCLCVCVVQCIFACLFSFSRAGQTNKTFLPAFLFIHSLGAAHTHNAQSCKCHIYPCARFLFSSHSFVCKTKSQLILSSDTCAVHLETLSINRKYFP